MLRNDFGRIWKKSSDSNNFHTLCANVHMSHVNFLDAAFRKTENFLWPVQIASACAHTNLVLEIQIFPIFLESFLCS